MTMVRDILAKKDSHVWSLGPQATVLEAARFMAEHKVQAPSSSSMASTSSACSASATFCSVSSPRGAIRRASTVGDVMTTEVACCTPDTSIRGAAP